MLRNDLIELLLVSAGGKNGSQPHELALIVLHVILVVLLAKALAAALLS